MELENVLGIIVYEDGIPHSFGKSKEKHTAELNDNHFHDRAFEEEILPTEWFKLTGYQYDDSNNIVYNAFDMCNHGFCVMINACSKLIDGSDYNLFTIQVPENMSDNIRKYLESIYSDFKEMIERKESLFFGYIYDGKTDVFETTPIYNIDEFYSKLNIKESNITK